MTNSTVTTLEAAAVPAVVAILTAAKTAFTTIFTGDPATAGVRAAAAAQVFLGQASLAAIEGGASEFTAVGGLVQTGLDDLITKVQAMATPAAPAPAA
ncbi:MAG: hypothetical protein RB191_04880 [Terriglobia bacterium]|nr:hypothetical protein [Terriglobia bacterium]